MGGQEGVQIDKGFPVQGRFIDTPIVQLGGGAQGRAVAVKERGQVFFARCRFGEQPPVTDLLDVAGLQVHLDGKPVLQLEQTGGVEHGGGVVLGQGLLGGGEEPDRAVADLFEVLGQPIQVEDEVGLGGHILADLVDDEEDVFLARLAPDQLDHLFGALDLGLVDVQGQVLEIVRRGKELGVEFGGQAGGDLVGHQRLVAGIGPVNAVQFLLGPGLEGVQATVHFQHPLQFRHLEVLGIAGPLQHLQVEHRGNVFHGGPGQHLAGQIEEDDRRVIGGGDLVEQRPSGHGPELVLQELEEAVATDHHRAVQGEAQVLGEGTLARPVESRNPDADFVAAATLLSGLHLPQQVRETLLDVFGDHVFGDFRPDLLIGAVLIGNDFLDGAAERPGRVEEIEYLGHGRESFSADVFGAVIGVSGIEFEKTKAGFSFPPAGVEDDDRATDHALELGLDTVDAQVGVQGLQVGEQEQAAGRRGGLVDLRLEQIGQAGSFGQGLGQGLVDRAEIERRVLFFGLLQEHFLTEQPLFAQRVRAENAIDCFRHGQGDGGPPLVGESGDPGAGLSFDRQDFLHGKHEIIDGVRAGAFQPSPLAKAQADLGELIFEREHRDILPWYGISRKSGQDRRSFE